MTGYLKTFVAVVALAALPGLSGCLGGGGGGSTAAPAAQMPREPAPEPMAEPAADPEPAPMADPAADPEPAPAPRAAPAPAPTPAPMPASAPTPESLKGQLFGREGGWFVANEIETDLVFGTRVGPELGEQKHKRPWSPTAALHGGVGSMSVAPLPDGSGVRVVRPADPEKTDVRVDPVVTVFEKGDSGAVFDLRTNGAVFGRVEWDNGADDNERWSAWGWWLEFIGGNFIADAARAFAARPPDYLGRSWVNFAAFSDGAEFQGAPPSLPERGTATYRGPAMGLFSDMHSPGERLPSIGFEPWGQGPGILYTGEFTGSVEMTMDFGKRDTPGTISDAGKLADVSTLIQITRMDGVRTNYETGVSENLVRQFEASNPLVFRENRGFYNSHNNIAVYRAIGGDGMTLVSGLEGEPRDVHGRVAALISNVAGAGGNPRRVAGTFDIGVEYLFDRRLSFVGAFMAPLVE